MPKSLDVPAFTINQLAVFVAVAETGTISGAAERLHVSPSAVSAAVTELERVLRVELVHRQRAKGARLTPTGEQVLARARAVLHQAAELAADARGEGTGTGVRGTIRLGSYMSIGPTTLPVLLSTFLEAHPEARIEVTEAAQDQLTTALEDGRLDLALMYDIQLSDTLRAVTVSRWEMTVVLPADHRLAGEGRIDLADLSDEPLVLLDAPPADSYTLRCCTAAGFEPRIGYRVRNYETVRSLVGRGLGWSLQVQRPHGDTTYEGRPLAVVLLRSPELPPVGVALAASKHALLNRAARTFVTHATTLEDYRTGS